MNNQHDDFGGEMREVIERLTRLEGTLSLLVEQYGSLASIAENVVRLQEKHVAHSGHIDVLFERCRIIEKEANDSSDNLNKWVNRGVGAYAVGALFAGLVTFFLIRMIDQYDSQIKTHGELLITIDRRIAWVEFDQKGRNAKEDREAVK